MNITNDEVVLHDEASILLGMPGTDEDHLRFKVMQYSDRLQSLKESNAPESIVQLVSRLQRKFTIALSMRLNVNQLA